MRRSDSSVKQELVWLLVFLVIFAGVTIALLRLLVPHHFNDRIAIVLSALISGAAMIALRAWYIRRSAH